MHERLPGTWLSSDLNSLCSSRCSPPSNKSTNNPYQHRFLQPSGTNVTVTADSSDLLLRWSVSRVTRPAKSSGLVPIRRLLFAKQNHISTLCCNVIIQLPLCCYICVIMSIPFYYLFRQYLTHLYLYLPHIYIDTCFIIELTCIAV